MSILEGTSRNAELRPVQKYSIVGNDHHVVEFITDYLRMMVSGNVNAHEIESQMDSEIETAPQRGSTRPSPRSARLAAACRRSASSRRCRS